MSKLKLANEKYKLGSFSEAVTLYQELIAERPELASVVGPNLQLARRKLDVAHNTHLVTLQHLNSPLVTSSPADEISYISRRKLGGVTDEEIDIRAIAIYLPQFHAFPENDEWWGRGFTEWTNVSRANQQFAGHYQPHVPHDDIGYYDLNDEEVLTRQAQLAKEAGIEGFCFYYYWFNGKRLMEMPVDRMIASGKPDMPFCYCWANENWTRTWDGGDHHVLIGQQHSLDSDRRFILDLMPALRDPRYIKVDGRPLLIVYRPMQLPNVKATAELWRKVCREEGLGEICLAFMQSFDSPNPAEIGYDFAIQFPPLGSSAQNISHQVKLTSPDHFTGEVRDYRKLVEDYTASDLGTQVLPTVTPSWDNTARRQERGHSWINSSPEFYSFWLSTMAQKVRAIQPPERRFVFINAWNEWAEGNHLEPDQKYGYAWLNATRKALLAPQTTTPAPTPDILIIGHDAARAGAQIVLLTMLREWKSAGRNNFKLLLINDGVLRKEFEMLSETIVLSDYKSEAYRNTVLSYLFNPAPKVVLSNTVVNGRLLAQIKKYGSPVITYVHELQKSIERWAPGPIMAATVENSDHFIAVSEPVKQNLLTNHKIRSRKITLIHPYIDTSPQFVNRDVETAIKAELGVSDDQLIVFGCGTTDWRKGPDLFVNTAIEILKKTEKVKFVWIGGSSLVEMTELNTLIQNANAEKSIIFIGEREFPRQYLPFGHLFFLSSREDPYPLVALEAAAAGLPIVCFGNTGGMPNFVSDECGVVVESLSPRLAARAMNKILLNPKLRAQLGAQGKIKVNLLHSSTLGSDQVYQLVNRFAKGVRAEKLPRVSVIIPNYNCKAHLAQRLDSIVTQTVMPSEIIILDDASTDDSLVEINRLTKNLKIKHKVIENSKNSGSPFFQWKKGLEEAEHEVVWIAEADDYASPEFLQKLLKYFSDPDVVLAYAQTLTVDEGGNPIPGYFGKPLIADAAHQAIPALAYTDSIDSAKWCREYIEVGETEITSALGLQNTIPNASATLVRRHAALKAVNSALDYRNCGDWAYYIELAKQGDVAYNPTVMNYFRRHINSTTQSNPIRVIKEALIITLSLLKQKRLPVNSAFNNIFRRFLEFEWELRNHPNKKFMHQYADLTTNMVEIRKHLQKLLKKASSVLVIIPDAETGGGQTAAVRVANALAKNNNVFLVSARPLLDDHNLAKLISEDVVFLEGSLSSFSHLRYCETAPSKYETDCSENRVTAISSIISWLGIDSIFSNVWWADKLAYAIRKQVQVSWFIHMHGCYEFLAENPDCDASFNKIVPEIMNLVDGVFYLDPKNLRVFDNKDLPKPRLFLSNNGVADVEARSSETLAYLVKNPDEVLFCMCARGIPEKGWEEAVHATLQVNKLPKEQRGGKTARLVTVGSSEYLDNFLAAYAEMPEFTVLGLQENPIEIMSACDIGMLPSYFISETQPNVVIEYMVSGLAVIATRHGGIPAMMSHKGRDAGLLVEMGDKTTLIDGLAEKMLKLMINEKMLNTYKTQSKRIFIEKFKIDTVAKNILNIISSPAKKPASV